MSQPQEMKILKLMQVESQLSTVARDVEKLMSISAQHGTKIKELVVGMANSVSQVEFMAAITTQRYQSLNIAKQMEQSKAAEAAAAASDTILSSDVRSTVSHDSGELDKLKVQISSLETEMFNMNFKSDMDRKRLENDVKQAKVENLELRQSITLLERKFEEFVESIQAKSGFEDISIYFPASLPGSKERQVNQELPESKEGQANQDELEINAPLVNNIPTMNTIPADDTSSIASPKHISNSEDNAHHKQTIMLQSNVHSEPGDTNISHGKTNIQTMESQILNKEEIIHLQHQPQPHSQQHSLQENIPSVIKKSPKPLEKPIQVSTESVNRTNINRTTIMANNKQSIVGTSRQTIVNAGHPRRNTSVASPIQFDDEIESGDEPSPIVTVPFLDKRNKISKNLVLKHLSPVVQPVEFVVTSSMKTELVRSLIIGLEAIAPVRQLAHQLSEMAIDNVVEHYSRQAMYEAQERGEDISAFHRNNSQIILEGLQKQYEELSEDTERLKEASRHQVEEFALQQFQMENMKSAMDSMQQKLEQLNAQRARGSSVYVRNTTTSVSALPSSNTPTTSNGNENTSGAESNRKKSMLLPSRRASKIASNRSSFVTPNIAVDSSPPSKRNSYVNTDRSNKLSTVSSQSTSTEEVIAAAQAVAQSFYLSSTSEEVAKSVSRTSYMKSPKQQQQVLKEEREEEDNDDCNDDNDQNLAENASVNRNGVTRSSFASNGTQRVVLRTSVLSLTPIEDLASKESKNSSTNAQLQPILGTQLKRLAQQQSIESASNSFIVEDESNNSSAVSKVKELQSPSNSSNFVARKISFHQELSAQKPESPMVRLHSALEPEDSSPKIMSPIQVAQSKGASSPGSQIDSMCASPDFSASVSLFEGPSYIDPLDPETLLDSPEKTGNSNPKRTSVAAKTVAISDTRDSSNNNLIPVDSNGLVNRRLHSLIDAVNARLSVIDEHSMLHTSQLNSLKVSSAQQHDAIVHCQGLLQTLHNREQKLQERMMRIERVERDQYFRPLLSSIESFQQVQEEQETKISHLAESQASFMKEWQHWLTSHQNQGNLFSGKHAQVSGSAGGYRSLLNSRRHTGGGAGQYIPAAATAGGLVLSADTLLQHNQQQQFHLVPQPSSSHSPNKPTSALAHDARLLNSAGGNLRRSVVTRASLSLESDAGLATEPLDASFFSDDAQQAVPSAIPITVTSAPTQYQQQLELDVLQVQQQVQHFQNILADLSARHDALLVQHEALLETLRRGSVMRSSTARGNSSQNDRLGPFSSSRENPRRVINVHPALTHQDMSIFQSNVLVDLEPDKHTEATNVVTESKNLDHPVDLTIHTQKACNAVLNSQESKIQKERHASPVSMDVSRNHHFQQLQREVLSLKYALTQAVSLLETHESRLESQQSLQQRLQGQVMTLSKPKPFFVAGSPQKTSHNVTFDKNIPIGSAAAHETLQPDEHPTVAVDAVPSLMNGKHFLQTRDPHVGHLSAIEIVDLKLLAESRVSRENNNNSSRYPAPPLFAHLRPVIDDSYNNNNNNHIQAIANANSNQVAQQKPSRHQRLMQQLQQQSLSQSLQHQPQLQHPSISTLSNSTTFEEHNHNGKSIWYRDFGEDYYTLEKYVPEHVQDGVTQNSNRGQNKAKDDDDVLDVSSASSDVSGAHLALQTHSVTLLPQSSNSTKVSIAVKLKRSAAEKKAAQMKFSTDSSSGSINVDSHSTNNSEFVAGSTPIPHLSRFHPTSAQANNINHMNHD